MVETNAIGAIQHIVIRQDNTGYGQGWFVDIVIIVDLQTYKEYRFPCNQWLARDQADGLIERRLDESSK